MLSSVLMTSALAVAVLASPAHLAKRVLETKTDVTFVTDVVTTFITGTPPSSPSATASLSETSVAAADQKNEIHTRWNGGGSPGGWNRHWTGQNTWQNTVQTTVQPTQQQSQSIQQPTESPQSTQPSPSSESSTASSTEAVPTASSSPTSGYQRTVIKQHNLHRSNHSATNIYWNETLAANAAKVAASCIYAHNTIIGGPDQGQNIAAGVDASGIDKIITDLFYDNEVSWYDGLYGKANPDMTNFEHWGHFSQIVWKKTKAVGCATQQCSSLQNVGSDVRPIFTVCNYWPAGNFAGGYASNVGRPLNHTNVFFS